MKIKVKTIAILGLIAIIIASENFFYLIRPENTKIMGLIELNDLFIFMALFWSIFIMYQYRNLPSPKYHFKWIILFTILLMISSSIQSYFKYGQSLILGIRPQRFWIIWALMYFPISKLFYLKKITYEKIEKYIFYIGTIEIILYATQYFLQNNISFLHVLSNNVYSSTRFYVSNIFLNLLLFINLDRIFNKKKILKSIIYVLAIIFIIIGVGKMRMTFSAVSGAIAIGIILWRNGREVKLFILIGVIISAFIMANTEEVKSIFLVLQGKSNVNTLEVRDVGREFYINELKQYPIFGGGYINTQWEPSAIAAGVYNDIYWVDNGIFGFAYFYGLVGVIWAIILFKKIFIMGNYVKKKLRCYIFIIMPIYWIIAMPTELHWYYNSFLVMTILICMLEEKYRESININNNCTTL